MSYFLSWCPAQVRFAGSKRLIESANNRGVGSSFDKLGVSADLFGDLAHYADELVERFACLRFGWFDHHGLMDDQRKVDGWRVHAKIKQALGDVRGGHTVLILLALGRGHKLVLADLRVGN